MALAAGTRLGPYEILSALGAGGMGEVYRARDTRLGREVAVKVLPVSFSQDADRLRRFEQEARAASALNHPNIVSLFDVGTHEGSPYVVSELLEGETLRSRLSAGSLTPRKTAEYAIQIAQGLAAAHEKSIVHRDLKPENLFVTEDGRVKILDFGLAKLVQPDATGQAQTTIPTASPGTEPGVVMGTVGYMSPEQVRGQPADHRSDIFSFGAILYEMLSGRRAFRGDSAVETMSAILKEDPPDLSETNKPLPPGLERLVRHCLEKSPAQRFQSARDLAYDLETISTSSGSAAAGTALAAARPRRAIPARVLAILGTAALTALVTWLLIGRGRGADVARQSVRSSILLPPGVAFDNMALSPDGARLAFAGEDAQGSRMLWIRALSSYKAEVIPGTDGASLPFWSADGRSIGYFTVDKLWRVEAAGGPATMLTQVYGTGGSWNADGDIVMGTITGPILRVSATGGKATPATKLNEARNESSHRYPQFLPDGRRFLYLSLNLRGSPEDEANQIHMASLDSSDDRIVFRSTTNTLYSRGYLLYTRGSATYTRIGTLIAQPFDLGRMEARGEPIPIADQVGGFSGFYNYSCFTASENGTLAYETSSLESRFVWLDRSGRRVAKFGAPATYNWPRLSPDGKRLVYARFNTALAKNELWIHDLERDVATRFTDARNDAVLPVWSPDGTRIAFSSDRKHQADLVSRGLGANDPEETLTNEEGERNAFDWSSARGILMKERPATGDRLVRLTFLPLDGDRKPVPLTNWMNDPQFARLSPDGRFVAYDDDGSGRREVYVASVPDASRHWQISNAGGQQATWRGDGKELFYLSPDGKFMSVGIQTTPNFVAGSPTVLFEPPRTTAYDVSADGQRFLVLLPTIETNSMPINLVLDWTASFPKP